MESAASSSGDGGWAPQEQRALERAMAEYPASMGKVERWDAIASKVGKPKTACLARARAVQAALQAKRAANAPAERAPATTPPSSPVARTGQPPAPIEVADVAGAGDAPADKGVEGSPRARGARRPAARPRPFPPRHHVR